MDGSSNLLIPDSPEAFWTAIAALAAVISLVTGFVVYLRKKRGSEISPEVIEQYKGSLQIEWRPLYIGLWKIQSAVSEVNRLRYLTWDMAKALHHAGKDSEYLKFNVLLAIHDETLAKTRTPVKLHFVHAPNGKFCAALEEMERQRVRAALDKMESESLGEDFEKIYGSSAGEMSSGMIDEWTVSARTAASMAPIQALTLELDRSHKTIAVRAIEDLETRVAKYSKHLGTTSELLAWIAAVSRIAALPEKSRVLVGHPAWLHQNYYLKKLLAGFMKDKQWVPRDFKVSVEDGEIWNYENPAFDREVVIAMSKRELS